VPVLIPISAWTFVCLLLVAAVVLAAWTFVRFRNVGPHSVTGGFFALLAAFALISGLPSFIDGVLAAGVPEPRIIVLFGLALPTFTYFFLAGGWFVRSVLESPGRLS
jgi:hypothetical protein